MIASPLEPEYAARVASLPFVDELFYDAALLPKPRYPNDHAGVPAARNAAMLAEFAFFGLLALRKDARRLQRIRDERQWEHFVMGELVGSRLAILGMGATGRAVAVRARAFGMRVLALNRNGDADPLANETFRATAIRDVAPSATRSS